MHTGTFYNIPKGNFTYQSANYTDILVGLSSRLLSFLQIDNGIKLILAPESHCALSMTNFLITQGMEKLPGYLSLGRMLFCIIALHSEVSNTISLSSSFFLLDKISLRNLA